MEFDIVKSLLVLKVNSRSGLSHVQDALTKTSAITKNTVRILKFYKKDLVNTKCQAHRTPTPDLDQRY